VIATHIGSLLTAGAIILKVDVAAGIVADTMKKTDATSSAQPAKKPKPSPKNVPHPSIGGAGVRRNSY